MTGIGRLAWALVATFALSVPAHAELPVGSKAPQIETQAAMAGQQYTFSLRAALRRGPVVLYFYPKAFTQGCTLEAHEFAEKMPEFKAAGASVIGMSSDDIATLKRFSQEECRNAFPVGVASPRTVAAYDVARIVNGMDTGMTTRTSYVIARDGAITMVHSDMDYRDHVKLTLAAVRKLSR